jgi:DNA-binding PadR family transcriptional regulator
VSDGVGAKVAETGRFIRQAYRAGAIRLTAATDRRIYGSSINDLSIFALPSSPPSMPTTPDRSTPDDFLPLKPDAFYVLLVLLHGERHGYAIMREAAERSDHRVELQAGALYRLLARMLEDGLVVGVGRGSALRFDDERRRYYRVTALGKRTIAAEAERMMSLAEAARAALRGRPALA